MTGVGSRHRPRRSERPRRYYPRKSREKLPPSHDTLVLRTLLSTGVKHERVCYAIPVGSPEFSFRFLPTLRRFLRNRGGALRPVYLRVPLSWARRAAVICTCVTPFKLVFDGPPPPHWCITAPSLVLPAHQEHSIHTSEASTGPSKVTEPDDQDRRALGIPGSSPDGCVAFRWSRVSEAHRLCALRQQA